MRIASRVAIGSTLVLALLGGAVATQRRTIARLASGQRHFASTQLPRVTAALDLLDGRNRIEEYIRKYFVTRDPAYARAVATTAVQIRAMLDELLVLQPEGEQLLAVKRVAAAWRGIPIAGLSPGEAQDSLAGLEAGDLLAAPGQPLDTMRRELASLLELTRTAIAEETRRAGVAAAGAEELSAAVLGSALLVSVVVIVVTVASINRPLRRLMRATLAVEAGNLSHRIEIRGHTELSLLARRFNLMVQRLSELDRLKSEFLSNVSHEIKTPLVAMEETSRLLLEEVPGPLTRDQRRMLELNLDGQRRLARLISDLLELSRMEAGVMDYHFSPVQLEEVVQTAAEVFAPALRERALRLDLEIEGGLAQPSCDRDRLTQVIHNLLTNAIRFSPHGGRIVLCLRTADQGEGVVITVSDQGPGVPAADRQLVFDRFHQGSGPRSSANVGLGLAICREIVEAHGGTIQVVDGTQGGASFEIWLPLQPLQQLPPVSGAGSRGGRS